MAKDAPPRKPDRRPTHRGHGRGSSPLSLLQYYRRLPPGDSGGFARPGPTRQPPLPLKFTCANCGTEVSPEAHRCSSCRHILRPDDGHSK